jgi:hypothetical protein
VLGLGGDCLADIAVLRGEPGVFGPVASDPTASRTIDALAGDVERVLNAINVARAAPARGCGRWPASTRRTPVAMPRTR